MTKMTKFEANSDKASKAVWQFEENITDDLYKKKYSFVFAHKELDFIIQLLKALQRDDRGEIVDFLDKIEKKTNYDLLDSLLIDRLLCSPEVEKK